MNRLWNRRPWDSTRAASASGRRRCLGHRRIWRPSLRRVPAWLTYCGWQARRASTYLAPRPSTTAVPSAHQRIAWCRCTLARGISLRSFAAMRQNKAAERFNDILAGVQPNLPETPAVTGRSGDRVISAPEGADPEIIRAIKPIKLHHDLSILFDRDGLGHLLVHFVAQPKSDCDSQRLKDMRHKTVSGF